MLSIRYTLFGCLHFSGSFFSIKTRCYVLFAILLLACPLLPRAVCGVVFACATLHILLSNISKMGRSGELNDFARGLVIGCHISMKFVRDIAAQVEGW
jgi:hypothetical protein